MAEPTATAQTRSWGHLVASTHQDVVVDLENAHAFFAPDTVIFRPGTSRFVRFTVKGGAALAALVLIPCVTILMPADQWSHHLVRVCTASGLGTVAMLALAVTWKNALRSEARVGPRAAYLLALTAKATTEVAQYAEGGRDGAVATLTLLQTMKGDATELAITLHATEELVREAYARQRPDDVKTMLALVETLEAELVELAAEATAAARILSPSADPFTTSRTGPAAQVLPEPGKFDARTVQAQSRLRADRVMLAQITAMSMANGH